MISAMIILDEKQKNVKSYSSNRNIFFDETMFLGKKLSLHILSRTFLCSILLTQDYIKVSF